MLQRNNLARNRTFMDFHLFSAGYKQPQTTQQK
jgi:hypothetical protein